VPASLQSGIEALQRGEYFAAIRDLELAAQEEPSNHVPLLYLGAAYGQCNRPRDAVRALTLAVRLQPSDARARYNLGIALERAGQAEEAAAVLGIALTLEPGYGKARDALERVEGAAASVPAAPENPASQLVPSAAAPDGRESVDPEAGARPCPSCGGRMQRRSQSGVELDLCLACRGVWFDHGELPRLAHAGRAAAEDLLEAARGSSAAPAALTGLLLCPVCKAILVSTEHGALPGIHMDACHAGHGLWVTEQPLAQLAARIAAPAPARPATAPGSWWRAAPEPPPLPPARRMQEGTPPRPATKRLPATEKGDRLCESCQAPNSPAARACWACGTLLQVIAVGNCPYCEARFWPVEHGDIVVRACEGCGGIWLEPGDLQALAEESLEAKRALLADVRAQRTGSILRLSAALLCPYCHLALLGGPLYGITSHPVHSCPSCSSHFIGQHVLEEMARGGPP
jgi:Zn-finger nucleic acid-binding protein